MDRSNTLELIRQHQLVSIIRGLPPETVAETAQALFEAGIRLVEVTFNQKSPTCKEDLIASITHIRAKLGDRILVGAGTVMNPDQVQAAKDAGASFILSASVNPAVIERTVKLDMVSIPGAYTPTEIVTAFEAGADIIKLFPAADMGINYIRSIRAPLNHIPMMAVGGIDEINLLSFLEIGLVGVGVGSNIVNNKLVMTGDFAAITQRARLYTKQTSNG